MARGATRGGRPPTPRRNRTTQIQKCRRAPIHARKGAPAARKVVCGTGNWPLIAGSDRATNVPDVGEAGRSQLRAGRVLAIEQVVDLPDQLELPGQREPDAEIDDGVAIDGAFTEIVRAVRLREGCFRCHARTNRRSPRDRDRRSSRLVTWTSPKIFKQMLAE